MKRADIKTAIGKKFKATEDRIAVFGVKPKFGGGRTTGFVTVYDDLDARVKYDALSNKRRVSRIHESLRMKDARADVSATGFDCSNGAFVSFLFYA